MRAGLGRLVRGTSIYTIGSIAPKAITLILVPVYTRVLSEQEYGILVYVAAVHSLLFMLMEMGLGHSVLRLYFDLRDDREKLRRFLGTIQLFLLAANFVVLVALILGGDWLFGLLIKDKTFTFTPYILLGVLATFFLVSSIVPLELFRVREQAGRYVAFQVGYALLTILAIIVFVVGLRQGALGALRARLIIAVVFGVLYWAMIAREMRITISWPMLSAALSYGLPLVPMAVANWVVTFSDRALLERLDSLAAAGLYGLGYSVGMLMGDIVRSVNKAYVPFFFDAAERDAGAPKMLADIALLYVVAIGGIGLFGMLYAREALLVLAGERFHAGIPVVPFVIIGYFCRGMQYMASNPLLYLKRTRILSASVVVAAVLNVLLNLWWIPRFSFMGAAYSTVAAYVVALAIVFIYSQRLYPIPYDILKIGAVLVLFAGGAAAAILPEWDGLALPLLAKTGVLAAFAGGVFALRIARPRDVLRLFSPGAPRGTG